MAAVKRPDATGTLGDVLYGQPQRLVLEEEWVTLVQSVAAGNQHALRELYDRGHRIVFTLALRITNSRETAEEVTLDVFHDIWRRASGYDADNGSVLGWIMNQAQSRAIDRLRFEQRKKRIRPVDDGSAPGLPVGPIEGIELGEMRERVRTALAILTPQERQAIETAFFAELSYSEVAELLDAPVGTVKTRIRSGLGKLRQFLIQTVKQ
ncbi:MAG TPA: sigma-70 family RNA polymerase sigma factor [Candidatus Limnocylindrales bacterium]|nr:sigma-70 family RNA polymerase sigma factor [Candidatus Limnocylindrales bacterium]